MKGEKMQWIILIGNENFNLDIIKNIEHYGSVENYLLTNKYIVDDSTFDEAVNIFVYIKDSEVDEFKKIITDLTSGTAILEDIGDEYIPMKNGKKISKK